MEQIGDFFMMDGYGSYIWSAYTLAAIVLIGLFTTSLRFLRQRQADLASLEAHEIDKPQRATRAADEA